MHHAMRNRGSWPGRGDRDTARWDRLAKPDAVARERRHGTRGLAVSAVSLTVVRFRKPPRVVPSRVVVVAERRPGVSCGSPDRDFGMGGGPGRGKIAGASAAVASGTHRRGSRMAPQGERMRSCAQACRCTTCPRCGTTRTGSGRPSRRRCAVSGCRTYRTRSNARAIIMTPGARAACCSRNRAAIRSPPRCAARFESSRRRTTS